MTPMKQSLISHLLPRSASMRKLTALFRRKTILFVNLESLLTILSIFGLWICSRQDLIRRLEHYCEAEPELFSKAVGFIDQEVSPMVARHAISGQALVRS